MEQSCCTDLKLGQLSTFQMRRRSKQSEHPSERPERKRLAPSSPHDSLLEQVSTLQMLLQALLSQRLQVTEQTMQLVARAFSALSSRYPRDFLNFIGALSLQPEPEVLGGQETHNVMLPHLLISGSHQRCPRGMWREALSRSTQQVGWMSADEE